MPIIEIPDKPEDQEKIDKTLKTINNLGKEDNFIISIRRDKALEDSRNCRNAITDSDTFISAIQSKLADIYLDLAKHLDSKLPKHLKKSAAF